MRATRWIESGNLVDFWRADSWKIGEGTRTNLVVSNRFTILLPLRPESQPSTADISILDTRQNFAGQRADAAVLGQAIAVGMPITEHPPLRTGRAALSGS